MRLQLKPIADQVIVVTGASSGIGLVTARTAASRGAKVMLVGRNKEALQQAVDRIEADGGAASHAIADVGDPVALGHAAAATTGRWGGIDTWVNCAGVGIAAKLLDTPLDEHERLFKTNYFGAVNGATLAAGLMRRRGGAIVTVASIEADLPTPTMGAYAASKAALQSYVQTLRLELIAEKAPISVTLIKPSGIDTPFAEREANHTGHKAVIPRPTYDPQVVADAILDAAVHPRREVTVGGFGRLQSLMGMHFPQLLETAASWLLKLPIDTTKPDDSRPSLFTAGDGDRERSGGGATFQSSLYTVARRHPAQVAAGVAITAGALALLLRRRPR